MSTAAAETLSSVNTNMEMIVTVTKHCSRASRIDRHTLVVLSCRQAVPDLWLEMTRKHLAQGMQ